MTLISQLLDEKGHEVFCIRPDETVYAAIKKMSEYDVGCLVVTEEDRVVGIITERHYAREVMLRGRSSPQTPLRDIMETSVVYAVPRQSVEECMAIMTRERVRHLPVMEDVKLVGLVSIGDLVNSLISEKDFMIDELVHYVAADR